MSQPVHRIALVTESLPLGGSTTFLINLAGELVRRGIPVEVISANPDNPLAPDFKVRNIPVWHPGKSRMIFEDQLTAILRHLSDFKPTVVVANLGAISFETLRYVPAGVFRCGIIHLVGAAQSDMVGHYLAHLDLLAVVSVHIQEELQKDQHFKKAPVKYLPLGVPVCGDAEVPARNPNAPIRILYVGRLDSWQKRTHLFPEILSQLCARGISFHWTIAGDGPGRNFLDANMKTTAPEQTVSIMGPLNYAEVPALLKQHDIFLLTSDFEGLPLSLLEAMGHGLAPVVSDLPSGIPEVVNTSNGILVPVEDVAGYARAIIRLHEHRDELAAKAAAARERVKKEFSAAAMADRWLAAFSATPAKMEWPSKWSITAPLPSKGTIRFTPPIRALRRIGVKLRP